MDGDGDALEVRERKALTDSLKEEGDIAVEEDNRDKEDSRT